MRFKTRNTISYDIIFIIEDIHGIFMLQKVGFILEEIQNKLVYMECILEILLIFSERDFGNPKSFILRNIGNDKASRVDSPNIRKGTINGFCIE